MADNVVLNAGSGGDTVAADDVSGVKYQLVQLVTGADGGAKSLVTGSAGLPVNDAGGSLTVDGTVAATQSGTWNVGTVTTVSTVTAVSDAQVQGKAAHDAAVSGNPLLAGAEARTSDGTAVSSGDAVRAIADTLGKQVVLLGSIPGLRSSGKVTLTNTTASDVLSADGGGARWVVTTVLVTNAHGTTGTKVEIRDGTTVKIQGQAEENGGGFALHDPMGLFIGTANTAVTARCVTTGADVDVFVAGYKITN